MKKPRRLVNGWKRCDSCRLTFSPTMFEWHRANKHRVLRCRMCASPIVVAGLTLSPGSGRSQFCSARCKQQARERGICRYCLKERDETFSKGLCGICRQRRDLMWRAISDINQQLKAMRRARFLPFPYRRVD